MLSEFSTSYKREVDPRSLTVQAEQ